MTATPATTAMTTPTTAPVVRLAGAGALLLLLPGATTEGVPPSRNSAILTRWPARVMHSMPNFVSRLTFWVMTCKVRGRRRAWTAGSSGAGKLVGMVAGDWWLVAGGWWARGLTWLALGQASCMLGPEMAAVTLQPMMVQKSMSVGKLLRTCGAGGGGGGAAPQPCV
jgi:hypothetical protein